MKRTAIFFLSMLSMALFTYCATGTDFGGTTTTVTGDTTTTTTTVNSVTTNLVAADSITSANFSAYSVELAANEFRIFIISNYNETIDTSDDWEKDAIVYQVFIRSFKDGGSDGCGDLDGLTSKLAYITNLGFTAVWTTPIFSSPSTHGYDISDYNNIDGDLGTMTDFDEYVAAAHNKGVKVILDMVLNHTSSDHTWFVQSATNNATYKDWYCWTNSQPSDWGRPWGGGSSSDVWIYNSMRGAYYYAAFSGDMPDLNYRNPAVFAEVTNIAHTWIAKGVDGFRLDAGRYMVETGGGTDKQADTPETIQLWADYEAAVKSFDPDFMLVGEMWCDNEDDLEAYYNGGSGIDQAFNFHFAYNVVNSLVAEAKSYLVDLINAHAAYAAPWSFFAPFTDNHDNPLNDNNRFMDVLGGSFDKMKAAAAIQMTFPGTPYVYYGTEIGMLKSSASGDGAKRSVMQWTTGTYAGFSSAFPLYSVGTYSNPYNVSYQLSDPSSLLNTYKNLIAIRKAYPALRRGDMKVIGNSSSSVLSYIRPGTNGTILVVVNLSDSAQTVSLDFTGSGLSSSTTYAVSEFERASGGGEVTNLTANNPSMYVRGNFNGWGTTEMSLISNCVWYVSVSGIVSTNIFKFDASGSWATGYNWGDNNSDGIGDVNGSDITVTATGTVKFYFNDNTLHYWMAN